MGRSTLSFDQIVINNKRSDTAHNDNDWMTIVWFVQDKQVRTDTFPLTKPDGDTSLDTGAVLAPFASSVDCNDGDLVTATFVVVNLGSTDGAGQRAKAEEIGKAVAKGVADAYVRAAELVVRESGIPLGSVFADGIETLRPVIVDSVGAAFDEIIKPAIEAILGILGIGPPDCNGEVLHDIAVFSPNAAYPITNFPPPYTAPSPHRCGLDPHTSVVYTELREFATMSFPTTPAPATGLVPVHGQSGDLWLDTWAEDPSTPTPIIRVTVSRSMRASGLYAVEISERVDPIHDVVYQTAADPKSIKEEKVVPFSTDIFGSLQPWLAHPVVPLGMSVVNRMVAKPHIKSLAAGAHRVSAAAGRPSAEVTQTTGLIRMWSRPVAGTLAGGGTHNPALTGAVPGILVDLTDAIQLVEQSILLCLYEIRQGGKAIGHAIRYMRAQNTSYTRADVMLFSWHPVR